MTLRSIDLFGHTVSKAGLAAAAALFIPAFIFIHEAGHLAMCAAFGGTPSIVVETGVWTVCNGSSASLAVLLAAGPLATLAAGVTLIAAGYGRQDWRLKAVGAAFITATVILSTVGGVYVPQSDTYRFITGVL